MVLREELLADNPLAERVRRKYTIRNTHGYRLLALLDGTTALQIFRRLLVGSEGTLAFVAEAVIETLPMPEFTTVAWLPVSSIDKAVAVVPRLVALGAEAVELMVAPALTAAGAAFPETPAYWKTLDPKAAALLVEFGARTQEELSRTEQRVADAINDVDLLQPLEFITRTEAVELAWHVREGLLGIVGKMRPEGSMVITEDVCFPPQRLAQGAHDLQALLTKHGFMPGVAGHAAHGNLHFTLIAKLDEEEGRTRYASFMKDLVELVVRTHGGSLKAEHGTGINMTPFVVDEWARDDRETCCPLIALPSDVMRGSDTVKEAYREVLENLVEIFLDDLDEPQRRERALALAALCVGGIVTPKCVDDPALADELRRAAHRLALQIGGWAAPVSRHHRTMPRSGPSPNRLAPPRSPREPHSRVRAR